MPSGSCRRTRNVGEAVIVIKDPAVLQGLLESRDEDNVIDTLICAWDRADFTGPPGTGSLRTSWQRKVPAAQVVKQRASSAPAHASNPQNGIGSSGLTVVCTTGRLGIVRSRRETCWLKAGTKRPSFCKKSFKSPPLAKGDSGQFVKSDLGVKTVSAHLLLKIID